MGLSASQGRLLSVTAKLSDLEFSAQQTSNQKIQLAMSAENLTRQYTDALGEKKLIFKTGFNNSGAVYTDLSANLLLEFNPNSTEAQRMLKNKRGEILVSEDLYKKYNDANGDMGAFLTSAMNSSTDEAQKTYFTNIFTEIGTGGATTTTAQNLSDPDWLYKQLDNGELYLSKYSKTTNSGEGGFDSVSWQTGDTSIMEVKDESKMALVKATYDNKMAAIHSTDKKFEYDLKQIDTEHSALQTEYESLSKVIEKNVQTSFKTFG